MANPTIHGDDKRGEGSHNLEARSEIRAIFSDTGGGLWPFGKNAPNHFSFMRGRLRWEWEAVKRGRIYCASCFFAFLPFCSARFQAKIFTASFQHELPGQKRRDTKEFWPRRQTHKTFCVVTSEETKSCSIFNILRHRPWQTIDGRWNRSRHAGKRFQPFSEYSICSFIQPQRAFVEAETL